MTDEIVRAVKNLENGRLERVELRCDHCGAVVRRESVASHEPRPEPHRLGARFRSDADFHRLNRGREHSEFTAALCVEPTDPDVDPITVTTEIHKNRGEGA